MMGYTLHPGDCLDILPTIPSDSVDCFISDPIYPCIKRDYGMMTEAAWMEMMQEVVGQARRILKPSGSAVFILQPNSEKVGKMRLWLWRFMLWCGEEWNIVQDAYWWNTVALPVGGAITGGLMRGSIKPCVWLGESNCYRDQSAVLWHESERNAERRFNGHSTKYQTPSGRNINTEKMLNAAVERGGVTPFNVLPIPNTNSVNSAGSHGHGAGTPLKLADWWTRYLCPPGGTVLDPFCGSGTMGIAALNNGCSFIGIEKMGKHFETSSVRLAAVQPRLEAA